MRASGVPIEAQDDVISYLDRGNIGKFDLPAGVPGPTMEKPTWASDSNLSALAKRIAASESVLAGDAKGADDYFKGQDQQQHSALTRAIIDGALSPDATARGLAIFKASPLFHSGENGAVLNNYTGDINTSNPMAGASIYERNQKGEQAKAGAVENLAQAESARGAAAAAYARAAQLKQETGGLAAEGAG